MRRPVGTRPSFKALLLAVLPRDGQPTSHAWAAPTGRTTEEGGRGLNAEHQTLFQADCLDVLRGLDDDCVDLIYLDPPFNSNRDWDALPGVDETAQDASFKDKWDKDDVDHRFMDMVSGKHEGTRSRMNTRVYHVLEAARYAHSPGMQAYLIMLAERIIEMRRVLKRAGSLYLHCDVSSGHYIKPLLDAVLGRRAFQRHITWKRHSAHNYTMFGNISDFILYYGGAPGVDVTRNKSAVSVPLAPSNIEGGYRHFDNRGQYKHEHITLTNQGGRMGGDHVAVWKGYDPADDEKYWCTPYTGDYARYIDAELIPGFMSIENVVDRLDAMDAAGLIHWSKNGKPMMKRYLVENQGKDPSNLWSDIHGLSSSATERIGYPTQKPVELLERIVKASSNEGDVILDPFYGSGTTLIAAERHGRRWIGADQSETAAEVAAKRLRDEFGMFVANLRVQTSPPERTEAARDAT